MKGNTATTKECMCACESSLMFARVRGRCEKDGQFEIFDLDALLLRL